MTDSPTRRNKKRRINWKNIVKSIVVLVVIACLGAGCFFAWSVYKETEDFSAKKLLSGEASKMYDQNGELMYTYGSDSNGKRENVTYEDLPQVLIDAVVSAEDSRFFEHDGFDLPRIARTMLTNLIHFSIRGGGSTITQQVIKKSYFPEAEKTYTRKLSEIILSVQATKEVSKEEIMSLYLNKIYFGNSTSSIGISAACKYYFNKEVSQLTLPEAALLAGTLNSPASYDPYYHLELATKRRNVILNLMVDHGYITQEECDLAKQVKIENTLSQAGSGTDSALQAYVDLVTDEVKEKTKMDPTKTQMNIYTYCNVEAQKLASEMASGEKYKYSDEDMQMAGSVQSTQDGRIVAVIGGRNYKAGDRNKATVKQQPGSSMKPIIDYGLAYKYLDWCTQHTVVDEPLTIDKTSFKNWDNQYHGSMTISEALVNSWNIPALTTFQAVLKEAGSDKIIADLESLGIDMSSQDSELTLPYAIGGWYTGMSPIELAGAYATIGNNGVYIESHTVNHVEIVDTGKNIKVDEQLQAAASQSIGEDVSFMIRETMLSYSDSGSGSYAYIKGIDNVAGKTGTSDWKDSKYVKNGKNRDLWMSAYTPDYACSVWMGFDTDAVKKGKNMSDYKGYPAKVVADMLEYLEKNTTDKKSYPDQPDSVEQAEIVAGVYPYASPSSSTPDSDILTAWFKKGKVPSSSAKDYDINNLSSFDVSLSGGKLTVNFAAYDPANATTDENATEGTKALGVIQYVVEVSDPTTNEVLHTETLSNHSGTLSYSPTGAVNVTGYYRYSKQTKKTSNKITKAVGTTATPLSKVNYTVTSGGETLVNGGTASSVEVSIKVNAQNSSNTISIQFYNSAGGVLGDVQTFTGSGSREFTLTAGAHYRVKITESDGTNTVTDTFSFHVSS